MVADSERVHSVSNRLASVLEDVNKEVELELQREKEQKAREYQMLLKEKLKRKKTQDR